MKKFYNWIPAILVMAFIFMLSATSGPTIKAAGLGKEGIHINGHFFMFLVLCLTFYKATKNIMTSVLLTIMYGVLDEFHQITTIQRSASLFDVEVDAAGAFIMGLVLWKLQPYLPKILKEWLNK